MKKAKMMALTGILLSSTILGANTTVVKAASTPTINVDKSSIANNVIQVINELLNSGSTASKVNSQTSFSDLKDGATMDVTPIFGEKSDDAYAKALQGELNIVDSNQQLVPMTVVTRPDNGFVSEVSYTLDGTTKKVNVNYKFAKPTVSFNNNQVMNFKKGEDISIATDPSSVSVNTTNGTDPKGNPNETNVKMSAKDGQVRITPSDSYKEGIPATRTVKIYDTPKFDSLNTKTVTSSDDLDIPTFLTDSAGNNYSVVKTDGGTDGAVKYTATAIDSAGKAVVDSGTNEDITFNSDAMTTKVDADNAYPIVSYKDINSGKVIGTYAPAVKNPAATVPVSAIDIENNKPTGTKITQSPVEFDATVANHTKTYYVTKNADTKVNFVNIMDGESVGTDKMSGNNGAKAVLPKVPTDYELVDSSDTIQTLNADQKSKDIYVKPKASSENSLSYTVTFKDKTTGKTVGTEVNGTGDLGTYVSLTAPENYAFASILDNGFILLKNNQTVTKYVVAADTPYNISYVDQDTGKEVGTQAGKGADGSKIVLKSPDGYAFVNADDVNYEIDKDTPNATIYVQKSDQTVDNIVAGYPKNGDIKIYNEKGKLNKDVVLSEGSDWIIDKTLTINGAEYYRVATNEYVKASDVYKYTPLQTVAVTNGDNVTPVYNTKGQLIIDRALDVNTPWYTDRSATIRGKKMYRVATDEWIKASDSTLK
ncbi:SLAP domain-containing protein [Companilactobacillus musae]|uniref:SLAP domain-containing protein n=1 Tax=Companilactobacillus musae TaxID=1903258 RepID=UPI0013C2B298|nr:SLAP domain-containing protein [Companilactobacillus musae]